MSKELEAFDRVWEDCSKIDLDYVSKHNLMDDLREIKKALTPPTSDEVCEALSDYYGIEVVYDKQFKEFRKGFRVVAYPRENIYNEFDLLGIPPHLITLVGRFYEGEIK